MYSFKYLLTVVLILAQISSPQNVNAQDDPDDDDSSSEPSQSELCISAIEGYNRAFRAIRCN